MEHRKEKTQYKVQLEIGKIYFSSLRKVANTPQLMFT